MRGRENYLEGAYSKQLHSMFVKLIVLILPHSLLAGKEIKTENVDPGGIPTKTTMIKITRSSKTPKPNKKELKDGRYACSECDKSYTRLFDLQKHQLLHTDCAFTCPTCNEECISDRSLKYHIKKKHGGNSEHKKNVDEKSDKEKIE